MDKKDIAQQALSTGGFNADELKELEQNIYYAGQVGVKKKKTNRDRSSYKVIHAFGR
jgi:hypothetical protein